MAFGAILDSLAKAGVLDQWWTAIYEPEVLAFGGPQAISIAHHLFYTDSRNIMDYLRRLDSAPRPEDVLSRRELSVLLGSAMFRAASQDWYEQGDIWDRVTQMRPLPTGIPTDRLPDMAEDLRRLMTVNTRQLLAPDGPLGFAAPWAASFRDTGRDLADAAQHGALLRGIRDVLAHHVIFHWNRIGLSATTQAILARGHPRRGDESAPHSRSAHCRRSLMWPQPDDPVVVQRMRHAHRQSQTALGVPPDHNTQETWGWRGRTLSQPVTAPDGPAWLRVACTPIGQIVATFWDGSLAAEQSIPDSIPRPRLRAWHDWRDENWEYRAELYDRVPHRPIAVCPSLETMPDLPTSWWTALRAALDNISTVPTCRVTIEQTFLDQAMPRFLGNSIDTTAPSWSTAHGDLHWANLCGPTLHIFDWEGWGMAPTGYDVAMLHSYSLLVPTLTTRIRAEFADILDTPAGRHAELVVITELLYSTTGGDNLHLANALRHRAREIMDHVPRLGKPATPTSSSGPTAGQG